MRFSAKRVSPRRNAFRLKYYAKRVSPRRWTFQYNHGYVIYDYLGNDTKFNLFSNKNNKLTYIMFHFFISSLYIN